MSNRTETGFRKSFCAFAGDRRGAAAIVMALLTPILIAGLAFGAEVGFWELQRRKLQNAVDTAAYAAATQLRSGVTDEDELKTFAKSVAEAGGYDAGDAGITLASPPASGAQAGNASALHVTLDHAIPRRFSGIYSADPITFTVAATALVENGRPACVLSLHPSADGAVAAGGSPNVTLAGCDIVANSISNSAVDVSTGNAAQISVDCVTSAGGVSDSHNNITYTECSGPTENAPLTADPYADTPEPVCTSYQNKNAFTNSGDPSTPGSGVAGAVNCYENVGSISRDIELRPNEIYVLHNSDVVLNGNRRITGSNVMIFLSGDSSITVNGDATIDISAPLTGDYAGIALFGDRDSEVDMDLTGNSGVSIVGVIYSPNKNSDIVYTGNTGGFGPGECTQLVGGTVTFWGSANFNTNCTASGTRAIKTAQSIKIVE